MRIHNFRFYDFTMGGLHPQLFVGRFGRSTRECDLAQLFGQFGNVLHMVIVGDSVGVRKGCGFVTFACDDAVSGVMMTGQLRSEGRRLTVGPGEGMRFT